MTSFLNTIQSYFDKKHDSDEEYDFDKEKDYVGSIPKNVYDAVRYPPTQDDIIHKSDTYNEKMKSITNYLNGNCSDKVNDEALEYIMNSWYTKNTDALEGSSITDKGITSIVKNMPHLKTLDLILCKITGEGLSEMLNLQNLSIIYGTLTDQELEGIIKNTPNLKTLKLGYLDITDEGITSIVKNTPNLKTLELVDCENVTGKVLESISKNMQNIETLELVECENVTDEGIKSILKNMPNLRTLNLSGLEITDEVLKDLENMQNLETLYLKYCDNITPEVLLSAIENMPSLVAVNLWLCDKITSESIKIMEEKLPNISFTEDNGIIPQLKTESPELSNDESNLDVGYDSDEEENDSSLL